MPLIDLKEQKNLLRASYKKFRLELTALQKSELDEKILKNVLRLNEYKSNDTLLCYVSTKIEVDTLKLIEQALKDKKRVAVPRCVENTREMEFYFINSLDELEPGSFGVLEPIKNKAEILTDFGKGLCIVPGLGFDCNGYRLGYGKGYYDRFLSSFCGSTVGICYSECVKWHLPHGFYDKNVDFLVTEKYIRRTDRSLAEV